MEVAHRRPHAACVNPGTVRLRRCPSRASGTQDWPRPRPLSAGLCLGNTALDTGRAHSAVSPRAKTVVPAARRRVLGKSLIAAPAGHPSRFGCHPEDGGDPPRANAGGNSAVAVECSAFRAAAAHATLPPRLEGGGGGGGPSGGQRGARASLASTSHERTAENIGSGCRGDAEREARRHIVLSAPRHAATPPPRTRCCGKLGRLPAERARPAWREEEPRQTWRPDDRGLVAAVFIAPHPPMRTRRTAAVCRGAMRGARDARRRRVA